MGLLIDDDAKTTQPVAVPIPLNWNTKFDGPPFHSADRKRRVVRYEKTGETYRLTTIQKLGVG